MTEVFESEDELEKIFQRAVTKALARQKANPPKAKAGAPLKSGTAASAGAK